MAERSGAKATASKKTRGRKGPRRAVVRIEREPFSKQCVRALRSPSLGWGLLYTVVFATVCASIAVWTSERPLLAVGRVMTETRTVRETVETADEAATDEQRELARQRTARRYVADEAALAELTASLRTLPQAVEGIESVDGLSEAITTEFDIDAAALAALQQVNQDRDSWVARIERLRSELLVRPLLDGEAFQQAVQSQSPRIRLGLTPDAPIIEKDDLVNLADADRVSEVIFGMSRRIGIPPELRPVLVSRVLKNPRATFRFDAAATAEAQAARAAQVETVVQRFPPGAVIFQRGDVLSRPQQELYVNEMRVWRQQSEPWELWLGRLSIAGGVFAMAAGIFAYVAGYAPRIRRNPSRMVGLGGLITLSLAVSCIGSVADPSLVPLLSVAPVVFAGSILVVAYERRLALAVGALLALMTVFSLGQGLGLFAVAGAGLAAAAWRLHDIRDRRRLLEMSFFTGIALALTTLGTAAAERPPTVDSMLEAMRDAAVIGGGGLAIGAVLLFLLPVIERAFDITTGMTLIELRDPKQPLLRELQQRAPGTYNHSLNVASIAETAADAIGADPLFTYVGALYHDIGKMNKPGYFVENQSGGPNKHDKLDPSMSLLVIVGHVKDGMEMAREAGLPRSLLHFIEAHHGTTLVEYFYERARRRASEEGEQAEGQPVFSPADFPDEVEYRYPGPKPRTKEVAILMMADAIESATRAMPEPTPARIDTLVRRIADKRLADGQFDDCDLTLRELNRICESIGASVASLYHGRIAYPSDKAAEKTADKAREKTQEKPADIAAPDSSQDSGDEPGEKSA